MTFKYNSGITSHHLGDRVLMVDVHDLIELGVQKILNIITELVPLDYVIFARHGDGIEKSTIKILNITVRDLVNQQIMPFDKIAYLSNIDACESNRAYYTQLCQTYQYLPRHLCQSANRQNLVGSNREITSDPLPALAVEFLPKQKNFLCFNRGMRVPRIFFVAEMLNRDLDQDSFVSLDPTGVGPEECRVIVQNLTGPVCKEWCEGTGFDQVDTSRLLDRAPLSLNYSVDRLFALNEYDLSLFAKSRISIVNEALYYYSHNHLLPESETNFLPMCLTSEKLQKCLMVGHPFMCVGTPGQLKSLQQMGYKTFGNVIDEGYDNIAHDRDRMFAILDEMERLNNFTETEWAQFTNAVHARVAHNRDVFVDRNRHMPEFKWLDAA